MRTLPLVLASVNTKLISEPETFSGKNAVWPRWSLTLRAYRGALSVQMLELVRSAEDPEEGVDCFDLEPGDDVLDAQLYFILTMLLRENLTDKVETVECDCGDCS